MKQTQTPVDPIIPSRLVHCAQQIAQTRHYPVLIHGLQPLENYISQGISHPGLWDKYQQEWEELRLAMQEKDQMKQYRKVANLLYYAACIDFVNPKKKSDYETYQITLDVLASSPYAIDPDEAEAMAAGTISDGETIGGKYPFRASQPYLVEQETTEERQKREQQENDAMNIAVMTLSPHHLWAGWPLIEVAELFSIPMQTLYSACNQHAFPCRQVGTRIWLIDIQSPEWKKWYRRWRIENKKKK